MRTFTLLAANPDWLICLVLYVLTIGVLPFGRKFLEGRFYNVARSSEYGDIALIFCIVIAADILREQRVAPWLESDTYHLVCGLISIGAGIAFQVIMRADQIMDIYHNLVVLPVYVYLIGAIALPVTGLYGAGGEIMLGFLFLTVWASLVVYDIKTGRLNQRSWLAKNGVPL